MQIGRIFRISLLVLVSITLLCAGAVMIGYANPTTRIVAQTYSYDRDSQYLLLLDIHRNLPIRLDFPVHVLGNMRISDDGRRLILPTGASNQAHFVLWEIESGRVVNLPQLYINCSASNWQWLRDNRHVLFQCRDNPLDGTIGGMYTFDFETGIVYPLFHQPNVIMDYQWSPHAQRVAINDNGKVHVVNRDGTNLITITPQGRRFTVIGWRPDGEAIFLRGLSSVEQYIFATGELEVLLTDFTGTLSPVLSPDGEWMVLANNERRPRAYSFHIASRELHLLETTDLKINNVSLVTWSPDSQWVIIRTLTESREGNLYYLARPNGSTVLALGENLEAAPVWASDNTRLVYETYDTLGTYYSEVVLWDLASFLPPQTIMRDTHSPQWSPNGAGLAFIYYPQRQQLVYQDEAGNRHFLTDEKISVSEFAFVR